MSAPPTTIERELQLKSDALEHSLNGFDIVDANGRLVYANRAYLDMWGYERLEDVVGTSPADHCADPAVPGRIISELKSRGECTLEFVARRRDGSLFDVRMWARLAHDSEGREIYPTTSIDITEEKRAARTSRLLSASMEALIGEVELEPTLQRLAQTLSPELADACIVYVNGEEGDSPVSPVAMWHEHPKKSGGSGCELREELFPELVNEVIRTGKPELRAIVDPSDAARLEGLAVRSYLCVPMRARGRTVGAIALVITEGMRRFDEHDLRTALLVSDRAGLAADSALLYRRSQAAIQSRDAFISICSHELKTPVTAIKLQYQTALRQIARGERSVFDEGRVKGRIEGVLRQLERMSKLIEDMLDVSRIATGKLALDFTRVDLGELVEEVLARFAEQLGALGIEVSYDAPTQPLSVRGDRLRLEQVLTNLLTNAIKYGEGRAIALRLRGTPNSAELCVQDQGIGIATEDTERIFRRFERIPSTANVGGLGLGLFITREILDAHRGTIEVESSPGRGTTFVVRLPTS